MWEGRLLTRFVTHTCFFFFVFFLVVHLVVEIPNIPHSIDWKTCKLFSSVEKLYLERWVTISFYTTILESLGFSSAHFHHWFFDAEKNVSIFFFCFSGWINKTGKMFFVEKALAIIIIVIIVVATRAWKWYLSTANITYIYFYIYLCVLTFLYLRFDDIRSSFFFF